MTNYEEIFLESYHRLTGNDNGERFFDRFYEIFLNSSEQIREKFANTEMTRQKALMRKSFFHLLNLYHTKVTSDYLERIASEHGPSKLAIPEQMFNAWRAAILATVRELDERHYDTRVEIAWAMTIAPGLEFMRQMSAHNASDEPLPEPPAPGAVPGHQP
ncbi:globin [Burkholderia sp. Bp9143]|uniref:globin n=1 Tax=Burkholderia sp. Bp9143 TaxID=2184574 RepID=UPI000F5B5729|nr:globin [Burkholderia sp. Bp9143]RQR34395.1 globin [Burkholderia sp. Bp9143]